MVPMSTVSGGSGYYWSSTAYGESGAYGVYFNSFIVYPDYYDDRDRGCSVRLVTDAAVSTVSVESVTLNKTATTIAAGATETLTATVLPETATDKSVTWSSSKESVATVDNTGKVTAVAAGEATITVTTTDGSKTATCTVTVTAALPTGALKGEFSVSATKKVHFSKGNLYYDGSALNFEASQYAFNSSYESTHVSHFTWSSAVADAVGESNSGDNLFCDEDHKVSVNGSEEIYYALSKDEWKYLINKNNDENIRKGKYKYGVTVCEKANCMILAPDDFEGTIAGSYDAAAWATAEAAGLVCLPAAGSREGSSVDLVGGLGYYWSSTARDGLCAFNVNFASNDVCPDYYDPRSFGYSVRLITDVK